MAHELVTIAGKTSMAYVGEKPWHGLGQELTANASIETWKKEAGMDFEVKFAPLTFQRSDETTSTFEGKQALYRGDTGSELAIVSDNYKIVQPGEILDFFNDLVTMQDMKLHTAGVLFGGRRFWALADTGRAADILGNDRVKGMLLLTTSCDGTLATTAQFTSVRVVCNNTLKMSLASDGETYKMSHRSEFDPALLKQKMGVFDHSWEAFLDQMKALKNSRLPSDRSAKAFLFDVFRKPNLLQEDQPRTVEKDVEAAFKLYRNGMGTDMANGSLWGAVNAVTEYVDHHTRSRTSDTALWNTWFGAGAKIKDRALELALAY